MPENKVRKGLSFSDLISMSGRFPVMNPLENAQEAPAEGKKLLSSLVAMVEITARLSSESGVDSLCRKAVEMGREILGFDRISIWLLDDKAPLVIRGVYGTDEKGRTRDERKDSLTITPDSDQAKILTGRQEISLVDGPLLDDKGNRAGFGWMGMIPLEGRERDVFGVMFIDFLLTGRKPDEYDVQIMRLYGLAVGHVYQVVLADEKLQKSLRQLQETTEGIVGAFSSLVEKRDPYVGGHQQRVARLAYAIAGEMGLSADRMEGIRIAGMLHDIGKMCVPSEILSKPGKLTDAEYNILKTHARAGQEILAAVPFPWPVAETVLQHHERYNGSGYPLGLAGKNILVEAQILAVADSVEAMSFHRPYRPAYGIAEALKEITRNKGVLFSAPAVDACVALFTRKSFAFE